MVVFIMLLSMGAGIVAETSDLNPEEGNSIETQPEEEKDKEQESEEQINQVEEVVVEEPGEEAEQESQEQVQEEQNSDNQSHEEGLDKSESLSEESPTLPTEETLEYSSDTEVYLLKNVRSSNDKTAAVLAWMYDQDTYLAVISEYEIKNVKYMDREVDYTTDRAKDNNCKLIVGSNNYGTVAHFNEKYEAGVKIDEEKSLWSIIIIKGQTLTSPFKLTIKVKDGDGHGYNIDEEPFHINKFLQVYHKYGDESPILDKDQSTKLDEDNCYRVSPKYENNRTTYKLVDIQVIHNGESIGEGVLNEEGFLVGEVTPITVVGKGNKEYDSASAIIIFIYENPDSGDNGSLTIKNVLKNPKPGDKSKKFDIFIDGPNEKVYTVSLSHREAETLTGLQYGTYIIKEIVPMNFENLSGSEITVVIDEDNPNGKVEIKNQRSNSGWFYDEDSKIFKVGS